MNPNEKARMTISLMDDGNVHMVGPLEDKILCYGMLEIAKQIVQNHNSEKKIVLAQPAVIPVKSN